MSSRGDAGRARAVSGLSLDGTLPTLRLLRWSAELDRHELEARCQQAG